MNKSDVIQLQKSLRETTSPTIKVDGDYGPGTEAAVLNFAATHGISGDDARKLLKRYADQRFVSNDAFQEAAKTLGVPVSYVRSIAQIESNGESFLKDGRVKILFERHWFYRKLGEELAKASVRDHIAKALKWTALTATTSAATVLGMVAKTYPNICNSERGGYKGNEAEWDRLNLALDLNIEAAFQAASYGGYQLMGFNHKACGYATAKEMAIALAESESKQFLAMVSFIKANPKMLAALRKGDWAGFARAYNGPAYAENKYDVKLADAETKWVNLGANKPDVALA